MKNALLSIFVLALATVAFSQQTVENYKQQIAELTQQIQQQPDNPALYFLRGSAYDGLDDFANSNRDFKKVLSLYKKQRDQQFVNDFARASYHLADDYFFRLSDRINAMDYVKEGLKEAPTYRDLEILEAIILGSDPKTGAEALAKYHSVSEKYTDDARLSFYYGKFLQTADPLAAAAQYEKVVATNPSHIEALLLLGTIYNNEAWKLTEEDIFSPTVTDYYRKSFNYYEKAYTLNPNDAELQVILYGVPEKQPAKQFSGPY